MVDTRKPDVDYQTRHHEARRVRNFLIKVGLVYVGVSIALFFVFSSLLRNHAYEDMSRDEIHQISQMVFESMFTQMLNGQGRQGIEAAARRMMKTGEGMQVSIIRSELVDELFGESKIDKMRRINDLAIFEVFKTGEESMRHKDQRMRFLYPAKFREECKQCHLNSSPGKVAGVVEIIYPINDLKVSTKYVNSLMLAYFSTSFIVLIIFLSLSYRRD